MIDPDALNVWFEDQLVGYLWRNTTGAIGFRYASDWINSGGFAVSRTLPLAIEDFSAEDSVAHAKNLSLLYLQNGEIRLAPFYDLICTRAIERIDYHLAFDVGGQRDPAQITTKHWQRLASQCDVGPRFLMQLLQDTAASLLEKIDQSKGLFEAKYGDYPSLQRIEHVVKQQCKRVAEL